MPTLTQRLLKIAAGGKARYKGLLEFLRTCPPSVSTMLHFSDDVDVFGLNPKYSYDNPVGIYGYPLVPSIRSSVINNDYSNFATEREYVHVCQPAEPDRFLALSSYTNDELHRDLKKLGLSRGDLTGYKLPDGRDILKDFGQDAGCYFWVATCAKAGGNVSRWNKIIRSLGYCGVVDSGGTGLVHPYGAYQGFFLGRKDVGVHHIFNNATTDSEAIKRYKRLVDAVFRGFIPVSALKDIYHSLHTDIRSKFLTYATSISWFAKKDTAVSPRALYLELKSFVDDGVLGYMIRDFPGIEATLKNDLVWLLKNPNTDVRIAVISRFRNDSDVMREFTTDDDPEVRLMAATYCPSSCVSAFKDDIDEKVRAIAEKRSSAR